jgi:hypothetical protein
LYLGLDGLFFFCPIVLSQQLWNKTTNHPIFQSNIAKSQLPRIPLERAATMQNNPFAIDDALENAGCK